MSSWALFNMNGVYFAFRWLHVFFGIVWIGHLYYFNFVQGAFFAETDATTKSNAIQKLVPRALWWFRWGAMFTLITGLVMLGIMDAQWGHNWHHANGVSILIGMSMGILMWFNVWFVIWPAQQVVIANATNVAAGKPADPTAAARAARAGIASRTNTLFSLPLLFFMSAGKHLDLVVAEGQSLVALVVVMAVIILGIEANALKGKMGPMASVKGVIHCSVVLTIIMYVATELLTK